MTAQMPEADRSFLISGYNDQNHTVPVVWMTTQVPKPDRLLCNSIPAFSISFYL
jgi:hypothetical protein